MPPPNQPGYDDGLVIEYLLGTAPDEDAERFDRLSIADDEFASRLQAVEHDLVDAYVRRALPPEILARFESVYFASPRRKAKVEFAKSLLALTDRSGARPLPGRPQTDRPSLRAWRWLPSRAFVGAACVALLVSGYLFYQNVWLRREARQAERAALERRQRDLRKQLDDQRAADASMPPERKAITPPGTLDVLAFVLPPQTRGSSSPTAILVPPGTHRAVFYLELESDDFKEYRSALRDLATNQIVWRSDKLTPRYHGNDGRAVTVSFSSVLLKRGNYTLELTGTGPAGAEEFVASYTFRVMGG